jgi:hypothetical protein
MIAWNVLSGRALANFDTPPEIAYTGLISEPPLLKMTLSLQKSNQNTTDIYQ